MVRRGIKSRKLYPYAIATAALAGGRGDEALPLDNISAVLAFSAARKLRTAYTGDAIRVRESSGDTEADIGFSGNALDESALTTHTGANNGLIATGYDQSGSGNNATQSTAANQPVIVASGTINKINGKPAADFQNLFLKTATGLVDGTSGLGGLVVFESDILSTDILIGCRSEFSANAENRFDFFLNGGDELELRIYDSSDAYIGRVSNTSPISANTVHAAWFTYDGGTSASGIELFVDGVQVDAADSTRGTFSGVGAAAGSSAIEIGSQVNGSNAFNGKLSEAVVLLGDSIDESYTSNVLEFYGIS